MQVEMEVVGIKELVNKLERMGAAVSTHLKDALIAGALIVQNDAKVRAPYRTGTLRRSIHNEVIRQDRQNVVVTVGTNVVYARRIEMGFIGRDSLGRNIHQVARPYLRPALHENMDQVMKEVSEALRAVLEAIAR